MIKVTPAEFAATEVNIAKINERAAKRGFTGRLSVTGERVEETKVDALGFQRTEVYYLVQVDGVAPSYAGWTFLARVDSIDGEAFTLATAPGVGHVSREGITASKCDHCQQNRARKTTYIVREDATGRTLQVGSTCLKDFLGWDGGVVFHSVEEISGQIEGWIGLGAPAYDVLTVIRYAYAAIRTHGFVPSSWDRARPTADLVRLALGMYRPTERDEADLNAMSGAVAEANEMAEVVRDWILSDEFSGDASTYVENLKVAVAAGIATTRQIGLLASAPQAYIRHTEREAAKKAEAAEKKASEFIGHAQDKVTVSGVIESIRYIQGNYGTTVLYTILTAEGNLVKWFASREALGGETGVEVTITGTVKKHEIYNDIKSTVLTRCKQVGA